METLVLTKRRDKRILIIWIILRHANMIAIGKLHHTFWDPKQNI